MCGFANDESKLRIWGSGEREKGGEEGTYFGKGISGIDERKEKGMRLIVLGEEEEGGEEDMGGDECEGDRMAWEEEEKV